MKIHPIRLNEDDRKEVLPHNGVETADGLKGKVPRIGLCVLDALHGQISKPAARLQLIPLNPFLQIHLGVEMTAGPHHVDTTLLDSCLDPILLRLFLHPEVAPAIAVSRQMLERNLSHQGTLPVTLGPYKTYIRPKKIG